MYIFFYYSLIENFKIKKQYLEYITYFSSNETFLHLCKVITIATPCNNKKN